MEAGGGLMGVLTVDTGVIQALIVSAFTLGGGVFALARMRSDLREHAAKGDAEVQEKIMAELRREAEIANGLRAAQSSEFNRRLDTLSQELRDAQRNSASRAEIQQTEQRLATVLARIESRVEVMGDRTSVVPQLREEVSGLRSALDSLKDKLITT